MKEIFERRSVRKYTDRPVTPEEEEKLLRAAMQAPSAGNEQPWHFIVVRNRETLTEISRTQQYAGMLEHAPMAVVVLGDEEAQRYRPYDYWVQDCSAALQNLLLEAEHIGLGAVWLGVWPVPERVSNLRRIFGFPETVQPLGIVSLGHSESHPDPVDRYQPDRVHTEKW